MIVGRRLQRSRKPGARMPESAVYVGRAPGRAGRFGNPFRIGGEAVGLVSAHFKAETFRGRQWVAAWLYAHWIAGRLGDLPTEIVAATEKEIAAAPNPTPPSIEEIRRSIGFSLGGGCRDVVCWCPLAVDCHGDVLLAVARGYGAVRAAGSSPHFGDNFRCEEIRGVSKRAEMRANDKRRGKGFSMW